MWGYAIFCEYSGCQKYEVVAEDGDLPQGWLSVSLGSGAEWHNVGTFCSRNHALAAMQAEAPAESSDARTVVAPDAVGFDIDIAMGR